MDSSTDAAIEQGKKPRKKRVWWLNLLSLLPMLFALSLVSPEPVTQFIAYTSLAVSLGAAYFSVRTRFNIAGLLLLALSLYLNTFYMIFLFEKH